MGISDLPQAFMYCIYKPVAPVVQVVNLEFYLFESWVRAPGGSDFDFICKNKIRKDSIVKSALQRE